MTELQSKEFELLKCFVDICDKLNLKYYLVCGTALGAIKYNGFIPWDDDIDVALCREDYEVFIKESQKYLPSYVFLQNYKSDPKYPQFFSKLRDSRTTYIEQSVEHIDMNHGVYIDIFPVDGYPDTPVGQRQLEFNKMVFMLSQSCAFQGKKSLKLIVLEKIIVLFGVKKSLKRIIERFDRMISSYSTKDCSIWCNHGNWQGKLEYAPKEQYGEGAWAMFEGLRVRVPEKYDEYLTQKYGDWRADPPESEKVGHHYYSVMDLHKPYTEYISKGE